MVISFTCVQRGSKSFLMVSRSSPRASHVSVCTATVNTETCEGLGLDFETVKKDFEPLCTQVNEIVTAESFDDVEK